MYIYIGQDLARVRVKNSFPSFHHITLVYSVCTCLCVYSTCISIAPRYVMMSTSSQLGANFSP